jgi:hypothetical protein
MTHQWQSIDWALADIRALKQKIQDQRRVMDDLFARHGIDVNQLREAYERASPVERRLVEGRLDAIRRSLGLPPP